MNTFGASGYIKRRDCTTAGFTLIELSIVLVIIGLIVGGVLVGRDLISAAYVRAQITQIEKFQAAKNAFMVKYGYLPGDMPDPPASTFGFSAPRSFTPGLGNGDGILQSCLYQYGWGETCGETTMFWVDLSTAKMIEGSFSTASMSVAPSSQTTGTAIGLYLPPAKIGNGNYVMVYSLAGFGLPVPNNTTINYFDITTINYLGTNSNDGKVYGTNGITVQQAYGIDSKIDDGLPTSGRVQAITLDNDPCYSGTQPGYCESGGTTGDLLYYGPPTGAITDSSTTCFGNGGAGGTMTYSIAQGNGAGVNCGLSFQFQ